MFCLLDPCRHQGLLLPKQPSGDLNVGLDLGTLTIFPSNAVLVEIGVALRCDLFLEEKSLFRGMGARGWMVDFPVACLCPSQALPWSLSVWPDFHSYPERAEMLLTLLGTLGFGL